MKKRIREKSLLLSLLLIMVMVGCGRDVGKENTEVDTGTEVGEKIEMETENQTEDEGGSEGGTEDQVETDGEGGMEDLTEGDGEAGIDQPDDDGGDGGTLGQVEREVAGTVVQIVAGGTVGSGVIMSMEGETMQIVTAAHVLAEQPETIRIRFIDEWETEASSYTLAEQADAALIELPLDQIPEENRLQYKAAKTAVSEIPEAGTTVFLIGSTTAAASQIYEGTLIDPWIYVEDYAQHMLLIQTPIDLGMSGGAVYAPDATLLGILSGTTPTQTAAIPLTIIHTQFEIASTT